MLQATSALQSGRIPCFPLSHRIAFLCVNDNFLASSEAAQETM